MRISDAIKDSIIMARVNVPVFMWGMPGVGKSDAARQIAADILERPLTTRNFVDFRMILRDPTDLKGFGFPDKETGQTLWFRPSDLPFEGNADFDDDCFLFLDEMNAASMAMQAAGFGLVLDRKVGPHSLKKNVRILAAGNRMKDKAAAQKMPSALANRFAHIDVDVDHNDWVRWADKNAIDVMITAFIRFKPDMLHNMKAEDGEELRAFPSPRSIAQASKIIAQVSDYGHVMNLVAAVCGKGFATEFVAFAKLFKDLPTVEQIINDPVRTPVPKGLDACYALSTGLARKATIKTWRPIMTYAARMQKDLEICLITSAVHRDESLTKTQEYVQWSIKNHDVLS